MRQGAWIAPDLIVVASASLITRTKSLRLHNFFSTHIYRSSHILIYIFIVLGRYQLQSLFTKGTFQTQVFYILLFSDFEKAFLCYVFNKRINRSLLYPKIHANDVADKSPVQSTWQREVDRRVCRYRLSLHDNKTKVGRPQSFRRNQNRRETRWTLPHSKPVVVVI